MILRFSLQPESLAAKADDITVVIQNAYPDAQVAVEDMLGVVSVTLPTNADVMAGDQICQLLAEKGIFVKRVEDHSLLPIGTVKRPSSPPKRRTVSLFAFIATVVALVLVFSMALGLVINLFSRANTLGTGDQEGEDYASKIALIDAIFEQYSLYDTNGQLLLDEMLKAYAAATGDRYATYYTEEEYQELLAENSGTIVGIGITTMEDAEYHDILVVDVLPNSPAMEAGLLPGDRIISIGDGDNQKQVAEVGYSLAVGLLRGEAGSTAVFSVVRNGAELAFSVVRAEVTLRSVSGRVCETDHTVGYVRITGFDTVTPRQFKEVMNDLIGKGCDHFVFDVRSNPGGDLKSINAILSYFLQNGETILSTVKKDGSTTVYKVAAASYTGDYADCSVSAEEIGMYRGYPMAVLTNGYTASAAELFTAVLKDYGLATVVGETTYGKGILQGVYGLAQWGFQGAIKLTTGYYNPPSGVNYDGVGIKPHAQVSLSEAALSKNLYLLSESEDDQLKTAINYITEQN
ncbi:MAG: PDZ domain-containing protein [Ruminococcaceae bacterium]|nr:PDZ domain-containing protein [Oscillospiraceae bacterium]